MCWYNNIIKIYVKKAFQTETAFRFNFFINILNLLMDIITSIGGILLLISKGVVINGWDFIQMLLLTGVYLFIISLQGLFIGPSLSSIAGMGGELWSGKFDLTLLKPIPLQFHISIRNWNLWAISKLLISTVIIIVSLLKLNSVITLLNILSFIISLFASLIIVYSILLIVNSIGFWYLAVPFEWLFNSLTQLGRYPVGIYPGVLKHILTWIIPIGLIFTVPAEMLVKNISVINLLGAVGFAVFLFILATLFFRISIRKYSSASS